MTTAIALSIPVLAVSCWWLSAMVDSAFSNARAQRAMTVSLSSRRARRTSNGVIIVVADDSLWQEAARLGHA